MRTAEEILRDVAEHCADGIDWGTSLYDEVVAWKKQDFDRRHQPSATTIRGQGDSIVIDRPGESVNLVPEHPAVYLVFEDSTILKATQDHSQMRRPWLLQFIRSGGLQTPPLRHVFEEHIIEVHLNPTPFKQHTACGKIAEQMAGAPMLVLPCLVQPCCVCGRDTRSLLQVMEQANRFQVSARTLVTPEGFPLGQRPGLDTGNHRDAAEGSLNDAQKAFLDESAWDDIRSPEQLEQAIEKELLTRHRNAESLASLCEGEIPPLKSVLEFVTSDPSIPYGWALSIDNKTLRTARSALALARLASKLHSKKIVSLECCKRLREPWTKINPGRSPWSNK